MFSQQKISDAENILFEKINNDELIYLKIAIDFYSRINKLSDAELWYRGQKGG
ncbi:DUF6483 family protein [Sedimentibacter sp.]|uniref:DUF6483 family protein n=1 Tax=Sedimentibacter sp. TaxID=1960295 RepID=UPI0037D99E87